MKHVAVLRAVNLAGHNKAAMIEKRLGTRGTGRNWNTVLKLAALAGS